MQEQKINYSSTEYNNNLFSNFIESQINIEANIKTDLKQKKGIYFTNDLHIIDDILDVIDYDNSLFSKKILEPSCGCGIFILRLLYRVYQSYPNKNIITKFIKNNLFFVDIDYQMITMTKKNINKLFFLLFNQEYQGFYNSYTLDFTIKNKNYINQDNSDHFPLYYLYEKTDYIIGNPPYITLYGRRDKKKSEAQRVYYLDNYQQFPKSVKNGKLNLTMLFIEHSLDFLRYDGKISFIIDVSFFETAYKYIRKYLLENSEINSIKYNISQFNVTSGQVILKVTKKLPIAVTNFVTTINAQTGETKNFYQFDWYQKNDDFRFRISESKELEPILSKIKNKSNKTLKELYPKKNLRTCTMLLNMENQFVFDKKSIDQGIKSYPYYRGSKSLKEKFGCLHSTGFFHYNKQKQDRINEQLKKKLTLQGIKNKKRIGLGEDIIYNLPKIYIRQSAKTIIATYEELPSAANNSLYVFSLRSCDESALIFLKFLCAYLNSDLLTFFCQQMEIIRYHKGKQPQIKISDLYTIPIPSSQNLQKLLSDLVDDFYIYKNIDIQKLLKSVNSSIYDYYNISCKEQELIRTSILLFQSS
ncbi:MAG: TaqI-like C-terminal specificity domain-containing protein [Crocosphaera sp.]|nr:TaqI-like C-terminal specificity domain-containing protein [Crocosphaera sp.]